MVHAACKAPCRFEVPGCKLSAHASRSSRLWAWRADVEAHTSKGSPETRLAQSSRPAQYLGPMVPLASLQPLYSKVSFQLRRLIFKLNNVCIGCIMTIHDSWMHKYKVLSGSEPIQGFLTFTAAVSIFAPDLARASATWHLSQHCPQEVASSNSCR